MNTVKNIVKKALCMDSDRWKDLTFDQKKYTIYLFKQALEKFEAELEIEELIK